MTIAMGLARVRVECPPGGSTHQVQLTNVDTGERIGGITGLRLRLSVADVVAGVVREMAEHAEACKGAHWEQVQTWVGALRPYLDNTGQFTAPRSTDEAPAP